MSSTNKTSRLRLNQWAATDPVLREDFNADNAIVDAAFAAQESAAPLVRLFSVSVPVSSGAARIDLNLSSINLKDYMYFQLVVQPGALGASNSVNSSQILVNGATSGYAMISNPTSSSGTSGYDAGYLIGIESGGNQTIVPARIDLYIAHAPGTSGYFMYAWKHSTRRASGVYPLSARIDNGTYILPSLSNVSLNVTNVDGMLNGGKICLYGIR